MHDLLLRAADDEPECLALVPFASHVEAEKREQSRRGQRDSITLNIEPWIQHAFSSPGDCGSPVIIPLVELQSDWCVPFGLPKYSANHYPASVCHSVDSPRGVQASTAVHFDATLSSVLSGMVCNYIQLVAAQSCWCGNSAGGAVADNLSESQAANQPHSASSTAASVCAMATPRSRRGGEIEESSASPQLSSGSAHSND